MSGTTVIRNSLILNDVYIGDNTYIDNCIVESDSTIPANSYYKGEQSPYRHRGEGGSGTRSDFSLT